MAFMIKNPEPSAGKSWPAILIGLFVAFGGVLFGYVDTLTFLQMFADGKRLT